MVGLIEDRHRPALFTLLRDLFYERPMTGLHTRGRKAAFYTLPKRPGVAEGEATYFGRASALTVLAIASSIEYSPCT